LRIRLDGGDGDTYDSANFAKMRREGLLESSRTSSYDHNPVGSEVFFVFY